jgi:UDP-perosamine 4-acetyltransferase
MINRAGENLSNELLIVGTSGHAKVIVDIIRCADEYEIVGLIGKDSSAKQIRDVQVIGTDVDLTNIFAGGVKNIFIAVGDNRRRSELSKIAQNIGFHLVNVISPSTYISSNTELGDGIAIMPGVVINSDSKIENNAIINTGSTIDHDCLISKNVHIAPGCSLAGNVKIEEGAFLGIGCKIIPEITVGQWSIIGAGSVLLDNIPPHSKAFGNPARVKGTV